MTHTKQIVCAQCGYENPQAHNFCGSCGARLDADLARAIPSLRQLVDREIEESLKTRYGDSEVVARELAAKAWEKLRSWLVFYGVVVTVATATLGVLGYNELKDVFGVAEKAEADLQKVVTSSKVSADESLKAVRNEADALDLDLRTLRRQYLAGTKDVESILNRVDELENRAKVLQRAYSGLPEVKP